MTVNRTRASAIHSQSRALVVCGRTSARSPAAADSGSAHSERESDRRLYLDMNSKPTTIPMTSMTITARATMHPDAAI